MALESQAHVSASPEPLDNARKSREYAAIGNRLRFPGGWPREEIVKLLAAHSLETISLQRGVSCEPNPTRVVDGHRQLGICISTESAMRSAMRGLRLI